MDIAGGAVQPKRTAEDASSRLTTRRGAGLRPAERKVLQLVTDYVLLAAVVTVIGRHSTRHYPSVALSLSLVVLLILWTCLAEAFDAYQLRVLHDSYRSAFTAATVWIVSGAAYLLVARFTGGFAPIIRPRISEVALALGASIPLALARAALARGLSHHSLRRRVVIIGSGDPGRAMADALRDYGGCGYEFMGFVDGVSDPSPRSADGHQPDDDLLTPLTATGIDQIVIADAQPAPALLRELCLCHERGVQITPMFALYQDLTGRIPVGHLGHDWFVALTGRARGAVRLFTLVKRAADIGLALTAGLLLAPIIPLIALAIRLDSAGPVLHRQIRVGKGGRPFVMLKFRTMRQDAEAASGAVWAQQADSRVTRSGRLLRKLHLDEVPQFWNVLVGDMSIVGPRPERPEFEDVLAREIPFYIARRAVRPGITGWAQVHGGYGNSVAGIKRKVEFDLYYLRHQSLYLDLLILLKTVGAVRRMDGL